MAFKGADSLVLLAEAARRVRAAGWDIVNIDSTIVAQAPKMAPHIPAMCANVAHALGIDADCVNVKAKTAEKMGPVGEGRAIEARAVCLLTSSDRLVRVLEAQPGHQATVWRVGQLERAAHALQ